VGPSQICAGLYERILWTALNDINYCNLRIINNIMIIFEAICLLKKFGQDGARYFIYGRALHGLDQTLAIKLPKY